MGDDWGDAGSPAGALPGCADGSPAADAALIRSPASSLPGAYFEVESLLKDMGGTLFQFGSKDLLLVLIWELKI
ncbi:MAG TPA: hypothetical protein VF987_07825 [Rhodospirillales bacterium]